MDRETSDKRLTVQQVVDLLKGHGVTPTQQRVEIAQILFARPQHLSAEQVLSLVNAEHTAASKATVYNTLNLFAQKGLVREVIVDPSKVFYDSTTHEHHHFFNIDTCELTDVPVGLMPVGELPAVPPGTEAVAVDVIIRIRNTERS